MVDTATAIHEDPRIASLQKSYAKQIHNGLRWGAAWLPSARVEVGDVGVFMDGVFVKAMDLSVLDVPFSTEDSAHEADLTFASQRGVSISAKAAGEPSPAFSAVGAASAGIAISFERGDGVVMSLSRVTGQRLGDLPELERELGARLKSGIGWQEDFAVVIERLHATAATILLSREAGTKVEFEAKGDVAPGAVTLASLSAGASLAYADAMTQLLVAEKGLTPLFHTMRLKKGFWTGNVKATYLRAPDEEPPELGVAAVQIPDTDAFEAVDFDPES